MKFLPYFILLVSSIVYAVDSAPLPPEMNTNSAAPSEATMNSDSSEVSGDNQAQELSPQEDEFYNNHSLEPEVTLIYRDKSTIQEYRLDGRLYLVKIMPDQGAPYYLMDIDGDGLLESSSYDIDAGNWVPQWILFSWK